MTWWRGAQKGVAAVVVVAFFGSGLFIALLGMIIDAGFLYLDRQTQQHNAEMTIARVVAQCNSGVENCESASEMVAVARAAVPPESILLEVCGPKAGERTGGIACAQTSAAVDCQAPPPDFADIYLRVRVKAADNSNRLGILDYAFPGASPDQPEGCVQVALAAPVGSLVPTSLPLALPACFATNETREIVLTSIEPSLEQGYSCAVGTAGGGTVLTDSISGFTLASLTEPDRTEYCRGRQATVVPLGARLRREPNEKTDLCGGRISLADVSGLVGTTQFVPVVGPPIQGGVGNYDFQVIGFRAIEITGFRLKVGNGGNKSDAFWTQNNCERNDFCLSGYFRPAASPPRISGTPPSDIPYFGLASPVPFR